MLAKEAKQAFDSDDWLFEIKWDGYRAVAEIKNGGVQLYSRNGNSFVAAYPAIVDELKKMGHDCVLDGEVAVLDKNGKSQFQMLQHHDLHPDRPLCYIVFDLLSLKGNDTTGLPLMDRKELLKKLLPADNAVIKYSDHIEGKGKTFFEHAVAHGLEGIMAKKSDSAYRPGVRSADWLKVKHHLSQEAYIVGYTEPTGVRPYFGALVLAYKTPEGFAYAGHTGTGFDNATLREVHKLLRPITTPWSPFKEKVKTNMPVTWVQPKYIAEIKHTEQTDDGRMRHPVFLRLRDAFDVAADAAEPKTNTEKIDMKIAARRGEEPNATNGNKGPRETKGGKQKPGKKAPEKKVPPADGNGESNVEYDFGKGRTVKLTNLQKIYFPEDGITKGDVVRYYQQIADTILPYLKDRPESMNRHPNGIHGEGFYNKNAGPGAPEWIKKFTTFSESANRDIEYIVCNDKAALAYMNNLGCIEINPWNSTVQKPDNPDYLIIDLDPSEKNTFEQTIEAARAFKEVLDRAKAPAFCKTSGSTGLHIFVPTGKKYTYEQTRDFAHVLCKIVQEKLAGFTTLERNLGKRGNKHIYLDYLQNRRGQTLACAYSLRPKVGACVSAPLHWEEVKPGLHPKQFTVHNMADRIKTEGDLFIGVLGKGIDMMKCLKEIKG